MISSTRVLSTAAVLLALTSCSASVKTGGPGTTADAAADAPLPFTTPGVALSEIMYHPVLENAAEDNHEFVELFNTTKDPIALGGWHLQSKSGLSYTFPAGTSIASGQYLVVAKNKTMLVAVKAYALDSAKVVGDYVGQLDNGGDQVVLLDDRSAVVDQVQYNDKRPWPHAADAFGAGESWLPATRLPLADHQYRGVSLERISFDVATSEVANWAPSAIDLATPGRKNNSGQLLAIAMAVTATAEGGAALIRKDDRVAITVTLSSIGDRSDPKVEYFVDDLQMTGEAHTTVAMMSSGADAFRVVLPPQIDNSIVRYRILVDRGAGAEAFSPRSSDPYEWHAYFVTPPLTSQARTYQMFIAPDEWTRMWTNLGNGVLSDGPALGCNLNDKWDDRSPGVFVHDGVVYDIKTRYQGSPYQRGNGAEILNWPYPGPSLPMPLKALSFRIDFPGYHQFDNRKTITLNKLGDQNCPGINSIVESRLLWKAGIPTTEYLGFVRLHINGGYYHYMMDIDSIGEETVAKVEGKGKPVGDLFKADGYPTDSLWTLGDASLILDSPTCNVTAMQRYLTTYVRQSLDWKGDAGHDILIKLLTDLNAARTAGGNALTTYFEKNFDIEKLLTQYAIRNWSGAWDDGYHNWFPYKRPSDGKWYVLPQDFDLDFGGRVMRTKQPSNVTFYIGEEGVPSVPIVNPLNYLKSAFIKTYRSRFDARLTELSKDLLSPDNVIATFEEVAKTISLTDWNESPAKQVCDPQVAMATMQEWIRQRHAFLLQGIK